MSAGPERRSERIATTMVAVVLAAVLVSFAVFAIAGSSSARRTSERAADEILERIGERTVERVEDYTDTARRAVEALVAVVPRADEPVVADLLAAEVRASPEITGAFVGRPDGSFRFVTTGDEGLTRKVIVTEPERVVTLARLDDDLAAFDVTTDPADSYDPRTRPWYELAAAQGGVVWTDPYVFFTSRQPGVTVAQPVEVDGELVAIVGVDLDLSGISSFVDDLPIDESAEAFLLSASGDVVAAPGRYETARVLDDGSVELTAPSSAGLDDLPVADELPQLTEVDDEVVYLRRLSTPEHPDWVVVVRSPEVGFVEVVEDQWRTTLSYTVATMAVVLLATALLIRWLRRPIDELGRDASIDELTGLPNRRTVLARGERVTIAAVADERPLMAVMIDIDDLKHVNDSLGHAAGDALIVSVADDLRVAVDDELLGRLGGDEFLWVATGASDDVLRRRAREVHDAVVNADGRPTRAMTMGVALAAGRAVGLAELITEADHVLIRAKRSEKGVVAFADRSDDGTQVAVATDEGAIAAAERPAAPGGTTAPVGPDV